MAVQRVSVGCMRAKHIEQAEQVTLTCGLVTAITWFNHCLIEKMRPEQGCWGVGIPAMAF